MKYWDTSALVFAALANRTLQGVTRPHALAEFYSFFTGKGPFVELDGVRQRRPVSPKNTVVMIRRLFPHLKFQEVDAGDTLAALDRAVAENILSANIHDYLHIAAAEKAGCTAIVTTNRKDFKPVTQLRILNPVEELAA